MQDRADKIPRKKLQLVGVTSMFIAAKYEEMYAPEIGINDLPNIFCNCTLFKFVLLMNYKLHANSF